MAQQSAPPLNRNVLVTVEKATAKSGGEHSGIIVGNVREELLVLGGFDGTRFAKGERIVVRTLLEGKVFQFDSSVVELASSPVPLMYVAYPKDAKGVDLRKHRRLKVFMPIRLLGVPDLGGANLDGVMVDISRGGCRFSSNKAVNPPNNLDIEFTLPGDPTVFRLRGQVKQCLPRGGVFTSRVVFLDNFDDRTALIDTWVNRFAPFDVR
ncbi:MAG: PilZ domain-containing protein [Candidatus Lambdaproteobacteria bacterium]|nr:PilZ domain-containing protein [Candidatus Lambdaproteobacteria bacterium]